MSDTHQTLNTEMAPTTPSTDSSPVDEKPIDANSQDVSGTEPAKPDDVSASAPAVDAKSAPQGDLDRFDKHPRWQEMIKARDEAKDRSIALEAELKAIKEMMQQPSIRQQAQQTETPARDYDAEISKLDDQLENGDLSLAQYNKATREIYAAQRQEEAQRYQQEAQRTVQQALQEKSAQELRSKFIEKNPDYERLLKDGTLDRIASEDEFKIDNQYTAFLKHQIQELRSSQQALIDKAVKETEERVLANFKAKQGALTLGQGPGAAPADADGKVPPELKNPKRFGGVTTVLANRLAARRQQAQQ